MPAVRSGGAGGVTQEIIFRIEADIFDAVQGINDMSTALGQLSASMDTRAQSEFNKAQAIGLINLRDFGSSLVIQAQRWKQFRQELEESFVGFEKTTQEITVLDESMHGMRDHIGQVATQMAIQFGITREEAAMTLRDLTALGISFQDASKLMLVAGQGAAAGLGTTENAATLLLTTMRQFGIPFEQATIVMAKLVAIANETSFNIDDMRQALSTAGPQAASLGFSLEETASAMAIMRDAGLDASEAGTAMRQFLIRLQDPTSEARVLLDELGISITDESGNFLDLTTILANVGQGLEGLTEEERLRAQATLFEIRGQQLLNITHSRTLANLDQLIDSTARFNDQQAAEKFLADKSGEALNRLGVELNAVQQRHDQLQYEFAQKMIPSEIVLTGVTNKLYEAFGALPLQLQNVIGGTIVFTSELANATGQTVLFITNLFTLVSKGPEVFGMIGKMTGMLKEHALWAGTAALAVGAIITAYLAFQEKDPGIRAMYSALTGLEIGLAAAAWAKAIAEAAGWSAASGPLAPATAALIIGAFAAVVAAGAVYAAASAAQPKAQHGAFVNASPGRGRSFIVGEGIHPEIIAPVPMMKETVREVIREEGGKGMVQINQNFTASPFSNVTPDIISEWADKASSDTLRKLRSAGIMNK